MSLARRALFGRGMGAAVATVVGGKELAETVESMAGNAIGTHAAPDVPYIEPRSAAWKAVKAVYNQKDRHRQALRDLRELGNDPDIDALASCSPVYRRALMLRRLRDEQRAITELCDKLWPEEY